jgi:hypothetical protein
MRFRFDLAFILIALLGCSAAPSHVAGPGEEPAPVTRTITGKAILKHPAGDIALSETAKESLAMRDAVEFAIRARGVLTIEDEARATLLVLRVEQRSVRIQEPVSAVWNLRFRFAFENEAWKLVGRDKKVESLPPKV